jgi:ADP-ribosyl-[dinitrogen reductase] hydrolase
MPNGGIHHCGNCKHFEEIQNYCKLRKEKISSSHWTTCLSWNEMHRVPKGALLAIVCEVKSGVGTYSDIPYYLGSRVDTVQDKVSGDTIVSFIDNHGNKMEFQSVEDYYNYYQKIYDLPLILLGALAGDIIGSVYEFHNIKTTDFPLFTNRSHYTDDTVMTQAIANKILKKGTYENELQNFGRRYPKCGFGSNFKEWIFSDNPKPYNSYGNGSAMRVNPIAYAFSDIHEVLNEAKRSAEITHNHPEGIKGAKAVAAAVFMARTGSSKDEIKEYVSKNFKYDLNRRIVDIRPNYHFDETCQGSVPEAIITFLESHSFENAIRLAVSIGGDSDTIASITGAISEAFYKDIPEEIKKTVIKLLPDDLLRVLITFAKQYRNIS